jgi:hypothetical protein
MIVLILKDGHPTFSAILFEYASSNRLLSLGLVSDVTAISLALPNSLDNILLKCVSPTKVSVRFVPRKATESPQITQASNVKAPNPHELASVTGTESHTPT